MIKIKEMIELKEMIVIKEMTGKKMDMIIEDMIEIIGRIEEIKTKIMFEKIIIEEMIK